MAPGDHYCKNCGKSVENNLRKEDRLSRLGPKMLKRSVIGVIALAVVLLESGQNSHDGKFILPRTLKVQMSMYGGFEQVGSLGAELPRSDVQTTTESGDIVLYSGNQIVVFYGSNSWAYTRLGHMTDKNEQELTELLGNENVEITIQERLFLNED